MVASVIALLLVMSDASGDTNATSGVRRLLGNDDDFFGIDNFHRALSYSEKRAYVDGFRDQMAFYGSIIDHATNPNELRDIARSAAEQGYYNDEEEDNAVMLMEMEMEEEMDEIGGVGASVPPGLGELLLGQVLELRKKINELQRQCNPAIATACTASALANAADPFPIPAIAATADVGIIVALSARMAHIFKKGVEDYDLETKMMGRMVKQPALLKSVISQWGFWKGPDVIKERDLAFKKFLSEQMQKAATNIQRRALAMAAPAWVREFIARQAGKITAMSQSKWLPGIGQLVSGAVAPIFMAWTAQDIRRLYSDMYFEHLREAIYKAVKQPVPEMKLELSKRGWMPGFRVWSLTARNTVTRKVIVKIDKDYGKWPGANQRKAKDFLKAVEAKGFVLSAAQCKDIASKMSIWNVDWCKDIEPGDFEPGKAPK